MAVVGSTTPLIALDAVVIDSETTSLDPAKARIVEIAAVRLTAGRVDSADPFRRLVRPDEPIPTAAIAIHHIDDGKVADAPAFEQVWPELLAFMGETVLIGHSLGFDLAVLKRECQRAKTPFRPPRTLDTRLLAEVVQPNLASFTLEGLSSWLGVEIKDRHSALGDAVATAHIFSALVPRLREAGVRTLGEAMEACRTLTDALDQQHRAGWLEAPARIDGERTLSRIDSYPYRHRVRDVMRAPAKFVPARHVHWRCVGTVDGGAHLVALRVSQCDRSERADGGRDRHHHRAGRLAGAVRPREQCIHDTGRAHHEPPARGRP